MMYENKCVLSIMHAGHPVREMNGTVHLPFNAEYKIRLKNKNYDLRAKAKVWVDGRLVSNLGDFILEPGQTIDLERFLDHSMEKGNKFLFVPLSNKEVNDPTDNNNGLVRVEFYIENRSLSSYLFYSGVSSKDISWNSAKPKGFSPTYTTSDSSGSLGERFPLRSSQSYSPNGATIGGSVSYQTFVSGKDFSTNPCPIVLQLRLRGITENRTFSSLPIKNKVRFCSNCGARRRKMADSFCWRCGNKY